MFRDNLAQQIDRTEILVAEDVVYKRDLTPCSVRNMPAAPEHSL